MEGSNPEAQHGSGWYWSLRSIVVLSTDYDRMIMEEEGSLTSTLNLRYSRAELDFAPLMDYVGSVDEAIKAVEAVNADLLMVVNMIPEMGFEAFGGMVRAASRSTYLAYLTRDIGELGCGGAGLEVSPFLGPLVIKGDLTIPHIVQLIEDAIFLGSDLGDEGMSRIVAISMKDPDQRHSLVKLVADTIWDHICRINSSRSSIVDKVRIFSRRPRILILTDPSITVENVRSFDERVSIFITDEKDGPDRTGANVFHLSPGAEGPDLIGALEKAIGSNSLAFTLKDGSKTGSAHDLRSLERTIRDIPEDVIEGSFYYERMRNWLLGRTEFELVRELDALLPGGPTDLTSKDRVIEAITGSVRLSRKTTIMEFSRELFDRNDFSKIGYGQLGGKGRGLAFLRKLVAEMDRDRYKGLNIKVPRTVVLASDVFDLFMRMNELDPGIFSDLDDARITEMF
ncbi:MAG: hypothetical protein JW939_06960, partial [Candidatus Thermoplasmatota archaeon]|nr:hypothetical protein [Candidatus Thermoplasmatota archaeon]